MTDIEQKARTLLDNFEFTCTGLPPQADPLKDVLARRIAASIQSAVADEREACAKIAIIPNGCACGRGVLYERPAYCHLSTAAAIRARAQAKEKP